LLQQDYSNVGLGSNTKFIKESITDIFLVNQDLIREIEFYPVFINQFFDVVYPKPNMVHLIFFRGKIQQSVLPESGPIYIWKEHSSDITEPAQIKNEFANEILPFVDYLRNKKYLTFVKIPKNNTGLLDLEGAHWKTLEPGEYYYLHNRRTINHSIFDTRITPSEMSGQELLTKNNVTIRLNVNYNYQILDPQKASQTYSDYLTQIYQEVQNLIRTTVSKMTLDELLENREMFKDSLAANLNPALKSNGIEISDFKLKDIILPGEIKTILTKVVEAEKKAQANVIKRREETAATRSLLNTARLMEDNPTLMRLKELETLEKVVEKVEHLNVYSGLEGTLKDIITNTTKLK
jgi:regulator of protease activity HflC (stomatin/prohibitin superfamily)